MKQIDVLHSKIDRTIKYVLESDGAVLEFNLLRKGDGKDIIVVPTQTSCKLGCTFCHLTGNGIPVRSLTADEIVAGIKHVIEETHLPTEARLLISFMGSGEPLNNKDVVIEVAKRVLVLYATHYPIMRFGLATIMPSVSVFREFTKQVAETKLPLKVHLSLHSPFDAVRMSFMPKAERVRPTVEALADYARITGNPTEIHYTVIEGKNDHDLDMSSLAILLKDNGSPPVKFLAFRERPDADLRRSKRTVELQKLLEAEGLTTEDYSPPGDDIGASCGQFTMQKYAKSLTSAANDRDPSFSAGITA